MLIIIIIIIIIVITVVVHAVYNILVSASDEPGHPSRTK